MAEDRGAADVTQNGDASEAPPTVVEENNDVQEGAEPDQGTDTDGETETEAEDGETETETENEDEDEDTKVKSSPALAAAASVTNDDGSQSVLLRTMSAGFASLRQRRNTGKSSRSKFPQIVSASSEDSSTGPIDFCISVNFIDPTTAGSAPSPANRNNFSLLSQMSSGSDVSSKNLPALDLYEKLTSIFERDYSSTLHSIPYENIRNGARGTIEKLMIRSMLTRSHGAGSVANGDAMVPWGGTAATAAAPVSDPQEWHNGPYCHVYIAACESMEHYRTKVKPSLQAFVSQIESAANSGAHAAMASKSGGDDMSASGNYSPHYVIVYVPTGPKSAGIGVASPPTAEAVKSVGAAFASRLSVVRRRLDNSSSSREMNDSVHSQATSFDGTDSDYESSDLAAAPPPGPVTHSSKLEKELYRKFTTDFPAGRTCIMSTLVDSVDDTSLATTSPLKNQEWSTFLHMLGSAIVSGFKDRCRRYDEELRRLDAHRATSPSGSKRWKDAPRFNLSHFFLVKESLAFTYEQMRLPEDALLQYEELRAFVPEPTEDEEQLPEENDHDGLVKKKKKSKSKRKVDKIENDAAMELAVAGDSIGFRRRLRSTRDMAPLADVVTQYLYAREMSLLFQMNEPVEIMRRSYAFVEASYRLRVKRLIAMDSNMSDEQKLAERTETERWALNFCWDVKCACEAYFSEADMVEDEQSPREPVIRSDEEAVAIASEDDNVVESVTPDGVHTEKDLARTVGELLEFGRIRLIKLGDTELFCENPVGSVRTGLPTDMKKPWSPLESMTVAEPSSTAEPLEISRDMKANQQRSLLDGAFVSADSFESTYLELTEAVISFSRFAGRARFASKLDGERAEICIRRGNVAMAAQILLRIVDVCAADQWERGHFWRLFRLACCQRSTATAPAYLSTLTHCFGQRLTPVAPRKALDLLQKDLEFVVGDSQVAELPLGIAPFMETELVVKATSSGKSTMPLPYMRKKVINSFCLVGEAATFELSLTSYLCEAIEVQAIRLFIVSFDKYESLFHSKTTITDSDAFKILSLDAPVSVEPGLNRYTFSWIPMNTGQYILSTVQIQWKSACFYYDSAALRRPLMGMNVTPSDPTQSLELNPLFLIPGHVQQVRIIFNSGSDFIRTGTLQLLGFEGLQVIPPGMDPEEGDWRRSCEVPLPCCPPGEKVVLKTYVKSNTVHGGDEQSMQAKVATSYYHPLYDELTSEEKESTPAMKTVLEAMVSTLDKPVLSVDSASGFSYAKNRVMISVTLHCNTPVPFSIKEWNVKLPELDVVDGGDLNEDLFGHAVDEGEQISFAFECTHTEGANDTDVDLEPTIDIVLEDEFGKTFIQVIPLDLEEFYEQLRIEDETAGSSSVTAELYCSADEGLVGAPVTFTYLVDISDLCAPSRSNGVDSEARLLSYDISCDTMEWILSGKVQGILGCSSTDIALEFVGIPVHPGVVKRFPQIRLQYESADDEPPIHIRPKLPEVFTSLPFTNQMAIACPAGTG